MSLIKIKRRPSVRDLRVFAILSVIFAAGLAYMLKSKGWPQSAGIIAGLGLLIGFAGAWCPHRIKPVFIGAVYVTFPIGYVVSHLVLAVIYYLVITPIGLIMRLVGYDPLKRRFDPEAKSYWITRKSDRGAATYFRQH